MIRNVADDPPVESRVKDSHVAGGPLAIEHQLAEARQIVDKRMVIILGLAYCIGELQIMLTVKFLSADDLAVRRRPVECQSSPRGTPRGPARRRISRARSVPIPPE